MADNFAFNIFENNENDCDYNNNNNNRNRAPPLPEVWIFGYGSLIWNPGFEYSKCITGYIRGYDRRFWQGNVVHRGTESKPGRVATLIENKEGITWGVAYKITGDLALQYLDQRECKLGGYETTYTKFYPRIATEHSAMSGEAFPVLLYIATSSEHNRYWLGEDKLEMIAQQIVESRGMAGHNVEYLVRLAMFMREELPGIYDEHIFELDRLVREELIKRKISLYSVMGSTPGRIRRDSHEEQRRQPLTFEFSSRVPDKKLRCLNI
jgi:cation transport protein ChaC